MECLAVYRELPPPRHFLRKIFQRQDLGVDLITLPQGKLFVFFWLQRGWMQNLEGKGVTPYRGCTLRKELEKRMEFPN
jgi:hypothetical protein